MAIELLRLSLRDLSSLQEVLEAAPDYYLRVAGALPGPQAAREVYAALPSGCERAEKRLFGVLFDGDMVGCADLVRHHPAQGTAYLGLLLLAARHRGKGFGRAALLALEGDAVGWGCERLVVAVLTSDDLFRPFWEHMGYADTGERAPWHYGAREAQVALLERVLG